MAKTILTDLNLNKNEIQNVAMQSIAGTPASPVAGQFWFDTSNNTPYYYDGTNSCAFGSTYTLPVATSDILGGVKIGSNISVTNAGVISVADASTSTKGVIEIATDQEVTTGTSETLAVNPKQLATKVTGNAAITGATKCKITYDSKGLVTAGADLQASDIPNLTTTKVNALTDYVKGSSSAALATSDTLNQALSKLENQIDAKVSGNAAITGATKTVITYDSKGLVTGGSEIGIKSGSTNYLEFDTTNHQIGAKVDTTVTKDSTKLVTSGAVESAIASAVVGGVAYKGTWDITSATDYSGITLPVKKGYLYYVTGTGPKTIGGIEWNAGDYLLVNDDVAAGGSLVGKVEKIDNTESADIVRTAATQTLTNKTIDADDNTISDLTTSNLKSGTLVTTIGPASGTGAATDTHLASEKAIRTELNKKQDTVTTATENNIASWNASGNTKDSGKGFTTTVAETGSTSDNKIPTETAVRSAITTATSGMLQKTTANNPALTASGGLCTWTVTSSITDPIISIREVATGAEVECDITYGSGSITVKINSSSNIAANTYKAVVIG